MWRRGIKTKKALFILVRAQQKKLLKLQLEQPYEGKAADGKLYDKISVNDCESCFPPERVSISSEVLYRTITAAL